MIIADLFVNLGIKGADKTVGALTGIEKGMKGLGSMSLETKAAILGAMYAFERLFSKSGQAGTDLTNFNSILGTSTQTLQQYQYAARQVGVSNQETENSFKSLQSSMTKLRMGEGAPKGYAQVAMLTGGITSQDVDRYMQNPELLLQRLQQYAQKEKRLGIRNEALKSFGLSDNMVAALSRNAFNPATLRKAPTYSDKEISSLDRANIAWSNLGNKIAMAIGHLNAAHGGQIVRNLSILVDLGLKVADTFLRITERLRVFELMDKGFNRLETAGEKTLAFFKQLGDMLVGIGQKMNIFATAEKHFVNLMNVGESALGLFMKLGAELKVFAERIKLLESLGSILGSVVSIADSLLSILLKIGAAIVKLMGDLKVFSTLGTVIENFISLFDTGLKFAAEGASNADQGTDQFLSTIGGVFQSLTKDLFGNKPGATIPAPLKTIPGGTETTPFQAPDIRLMVPQAPDIRLVVPQAPVAPAAPNVPRGATTSKTTTQNFNVNQSFSYASDGKDARNTADSMKKAVNDAFRQMSSQVQGS